MEQIFEYVTFDQTVKRSVGSSRECCSIAPKNEGPLLALHCGCGAFPANFFCSFTSSSEICWVTINCDFSYTAFGHVEKSEHELKEARAEMLVADAYHLPFCDDSFDIIFEKGLFDSATASMDATLQLQNASALLEEYLRVLKVGGLVRILSIFEPCGEVKDMLGLLHNEQLSVECINVPIMPAEVPGQPFSFLYECKKLR
jgi:ubiquinone/menaquinone biosynthesis C-methylase UbiE